ncbi:MAG: leucine-rich repeat domain-containing protein [Oscillospiraceae bacterium]|jgi:hypothetical protein|nr:leucine-rich repeat domain-containing protein [Oscillospiraceae bacterium]
MNFKKTTCFLCLCALLALSGCKGGNAPASTVTGSTMATTEPVTAAPVLWDPADANGSDLPTATENGLTYEIRNGYVCIIATALHQEQQIEIPATLGGLPVLALGNAVFHNYDVTESITLPEGLVAIEGTGFSSCRAIKTLHLPKSLIHITFGLGFGCESLESVTVAEGNPAFSSVEGVLFNKELTELRYYPEGRPGEEYTIPATVRSLSDSAFGRLQTHLKTLYIPATVTAFPDTYIFGVFPRSVTVVVPPNSAALAYVTELAKTDEDILYRTEAFAPAA